MGTTMRCPWELLDKETLEWVGCTESWPHQGMTHHIGRFILSTEALEALRDKGLPIVRRTW